jgi:AAA domain-containing protein/Toprim domain-containing protein
MNALSCEAIARAVLGAPVKREGAELFYNCPHSELHANGDAHPSLKINTKKNVWGCFPHNASGAAWQFAAFLAGLDVGDKRGVSTWLRERGLLQERSGNDGRIVAQYLKRPALTVAQFAEAKKLPLHFLDEMGLEDCTEGVRIVYRLVDGSRAPRQRIRIALRAKDGSHWSGGEGEIVPYGLWLLDEARARGELFMAEGETDMLTLSWAGLPALGLPGAGTAKLLRREYLEGIRKVYVTRDNDPAGEQFLSGVRDRLREIGFTGQIFVVQVPPPHKDVSEFIERGGPRDGLLELIRNAPEWKPSAQPQQRGFKLTILRDLLNEPEEKILWLLAAKLPAGGISVVSAKPKVGKSTFARCLAQAVARGEPFLGCETIQGPVIYLALEEKRSEVRQHFADLGATGEEPIHIHCAAAPKDAMPELCKVVAELKPALVIVDPLFKFVRVADEKAYAEVCQAIEPLLTLARESGAHVMLVHHNTKAERADAMDTILGSTAIFGGVDSALILKRTDRYRTLQSSQRYGTDWPETVLEFDSERRALSLGVEKSQAEAERIGQAILDYLQGSEEPRAREEIEAQVEGKTGPTRNALRQLVEQRKVGREGSGRRGDPFRYRFLFSCSPYIPRTREQETENRPETRVNTGDILVSDFPQNLIPVPAAQRDEKQDGERGLFARKDDGDEVLL